MSIEVTKAPPTGVNEEDYVAAVNAAHTFMTCLNKCIGEKEDLTRSGIVRTPERVTRAYLELMAGYNLPYDITLFSDENDDSDDETNGEGPVLVMNIPFNSMCEHHLLPFSGLVHVAYIRNNKILGLSKFARNLRVLASRWQVQERLTKQYCKLIMKELDAKGAAVMIEATHSCMCIRGAKTNGKTVTCYYTGEMNTNERKEEFMRMISNGTL